ncbi:MAG: hypothetical protein OSB07_04680 [Dehalococcoidia bacterium]|nr:hypothetical protein [Dehalococcoidia bacterium]
MTNANGLSIGQCLSNHTLHSLRLGVPFVVMPWDMESHGVHFKLEDSGSTRT